jgi:hypothetical protein
MNQLHSAIRAALAPFAPAQSSVQFTEDELIQADAAVQRWKDGHHERNDAQALALQIKHSPQHWGIE